MSHNAYSFEIKELPDEIVFLIDSCLLFFFKSHSPLATTLLTFYADNVSSFLLAFFLLSRLPRFISMVFVLSNVVILVSGSCSNGTIAAVRIC